MLALKDTNLLRQACYIDGAWVGADSGETFPVTNPPSAAASVAAGSTC
jgi:succinate-semialdehyde dehydrogenase/glutarate-semialdehyde dehydrogenase